MGKTLYIFGNGFDLAHGLPTSYKDFHQWLIDNHDIWFIKAFEALYQNININGRWCDIESSLKQLTLKEAVDFDRYYQDCGDAIMNENSSHDAYRCGENLSRVIEALPSCLLDWVNCISLDNCTQTFKFPANAHFFSFNYTRTLEELYDINSKQIYHIHGAVGDNRELIIGYDEDNFDVEGDSAPDFSDVDIFTIVDKLRKNKKPVNAFIQYGSFTKFLKSINDVSSVIIFGYSCPNVDQPYFKRIASHINKEAIWTVYVHDKKYKKHASNYIGSIIQPNQSISVTNCPPLERL